jgi:hypothetical protein
MEKKVSKTKFSWKNYWKPTPVKFRRLGDALFGIFSITSMSSIVTEHRQLGIASLIIGTLGKVLTNFFSEEPVTNQADENQAD